ncbi:MAG: glutaredoxin family protein [Thermoanaerobaculia bacterium]
MQSKVEVVLYTRAACSLCEKALAAIHDATMRHGLSIALAEIDVDYDLDLLTRFNDHVPVVYIAGREAFRHHVDADAFAAAVHSSPRSGDGE